MKRIVFSLIMLSSVMVFADDVPWVNYYINYKACMQSVSPGTSIFCKNIGLTAKDVAEMKAQMTIKPPLDPDMARLINEKGQLEVAYNDSCILVERQPSSCNELIKVKLEKVEAEIAAKKFDQTLADLQAKLSYLEANTNCEWIAERVMPKCDPVIESQIEDTKTKIAERKAELIRERGY